MMMQPFFFFGSMLRKYEIMPQGWKWSLPCAAVVVAAFLANGVSEVNGRLYSNVAILFLGGIAGTLLTFQFSHYLDTLRPARRLADFLILCGKWTLFLLIVHGIVEVRIAQIWLYLAGIPVTEELRGFPAYALPYAILATPVSIAVPLLLIKLFRNTWFLRLFRAAR